MKLKGIILAVILSLASIMMPFSVYAYEQSSIVPTFSSSTSQWNGHLHITNFSDGTNTQASSVLEFTLDDDYYGMIYFDGYGPSNQHIANYAVCYVAGGRGEWRYSYYQNGVINITSVTINIVSVVKPQSTIDLTQIITLLTAIENDTSSIDNVLDTTLAQIRLVLAELIESNGYLEILTKLKDWKFPIESFPFVSSFLNYNKNYLTDYYIQYNNYSFPIFDLPSSAMIYPISSNTDDFYMILFIADGQAYNLNNIKNQIIDFGTLSVDEFSYWGNTRVWQNGQTGYFVKFTIHVSGSTTFNIRTKKAVQIIPIYFNRKSINFNSTEFALQFGLSNRLLDDIHIIANGTTQSNTAASDLESGNSQMADDMDDLATIESGYNQQFNNQLQSIDFTSPIQSNAGILPAANFVITIFNGLINNNPFSVLIIIVCILLIGKKVIGK